MCSKLQMQIGFSPMYSYMSPVYYSDDCTTLYSVHVARSEDVGGGYRSGDELSAARSGHFTPPVTLWTGYCIICY